MSDYEYHKGKIRKVNLEEFDNSTEKYFEACYRFDHKDLTEEEIQERYQMITQNKWREYDPWEELWRDDDNHKHQVLNVNGDLYEAFDEELDEECNCLLFKHKNGEYEYYCSFYNGGTHLIEVLENKLKKQIK